MRQGAGISFNRIAFLVSIQTVVGMFGTVTAGYLMDRFGITRVLPLFFLLSAILFGFLGASDLHSNLASFIFILLGYTIYSGLAGLNALVASTYPSLFRVTGVAWSSGGAGRIGGMVATVVGGFVLTNFPHSTSIYSIAAGPELLAAITLYFAASRSEQYNSDAHGSNVVDNSTQNTSTVEWQAPDL
jgi:MFS family permease